MAKQQVQSKKVSKASKPLIPEKYQDVFYVGMIFIAVIVFFGSAIFGNGFDAADTISSLSFKTFLEEARSEGKFPLWIPYIFSGMPSYASLLTTGERLWDFIPQIVFGFAAFIGKLFNNDVARLAFWYSFYGAGIYFLVKSKKQDRYIAYFAAVAAIFSTWIIIWAMIGHNTKPVVFAFVPFLFLFLEKLRERFSLLYTVLLIFAIHLMFEAGHLQMIFYSLLALGLYVVIELINRLVTKNEPIPFLRASAVLAVAVGIAFLMSADRYFATMEYTPYSTRGTAPIVKTESGHQDESGGNDYDYATMWSFSPQEIKTFFVPNYYGFGKLEYKGPLTQNRAIKMHTYWGQKPFEDAAAYMGIIVLMLAFVGFYKNIRDVFVQFLAILGAFALLLSFGYTFPIVFDFFYHYVPYFNKFRAPSMALVLLQFVVPILAAYGLAAIFEMRRNPEKNDKCILYGLLGFGGSFLLLGLIYSSIFQTSYIESVTSSKLGQQMVEGYGAATFNEIAKFIWEQMIADWYTVGFIALLGALLVFLFVRSKVTSPIFMFAMLFLLIFDLWRVGYRPMEVADKKPEKYVFQRTDWVDFIQNDKSKFRVADFTSHAANLPAYYKLETVGGYHSAKLRVYQDLLDVADQGSTSQVTNPFLWNILNVKYIIANKQLGGMPPAYHSPQTGSYVYLNPKHVPRAFFVDTFAIASQLDILGNLKEGNFDPLELAYLEKQPHQNIQPRSENAKVSIVEYKNEYIKLEAETDATNLLVLSEIYYPVSWKAYINGNETEVYKTNFALRSIVVPPGKNTIEFKFTSDGFEQGKMISTSLNIVTIILLALGIFFEWKRRKKQIGDR